MCSSKSKRRRLLSNLMAGKDGSNSEEEAFYVKGSNESGFANRQKDIFASLSSLEAKHQEFQNDLDKELEKKGQVEKDVSDFDFPVPQSRPAKKNLKFVPQFKLNPGKWTKYSLADVDSDQMSDKSNTAAALSFLNQRKRQKFDESTDGEPGNIVFKKKDAIKDGDVDKDDTTGSQSFRSGKWVMPEYQVGKSKDSKVRPKTKKTDRGSESIGNQVGLSHLEIEDDDADDDVIEKPPITFNKRSKPKTVFRKTTEDQEYSD